MWCVLLLVNLLGTSVTPLITGPRNWLVKLNSDELAHVREKCSPKQQNSRVSDRIVGGHPAEPGKFKFAAMFTTTLLQETRTHCGATLISPRHLITARHCFEGKQLYYELLMGGVCHLLAGDCPGKPDMIPLEYEFAIFDTEYNIRKDYLDVAIVQLKEKISDTLAERIDFACLPKVIDEDPPTEIIMVGWGQKEDNQWSDVQRHVTLLTKHPCSDGNSSFCTMPSSSSVSWAQARGGDSGSGGVTYSKNAGKFVIHGIIIMGEKDGTTRLVKVSYLLDDLCFYVGLCVSHTINAIKPRLQLNSFYFPKGHKKSMPNMMALFTKIPDAKSEEFATNCKSAAKSAETNSATRMDVCAIPVYWSMAVVSRSNGETERLCDAVLVTDQHMITTRECILPYIKNVPHGNLLILIAQRNCLRSYCDFWEIELISWAFSHSMAIIQLKAAKLPTNIPVCFINGRKSKDEEFVGFERELIKVEGYRADYLQDSHELASNMLTESQPQKYNIHSPKNVAKKLPASHDEVKEIHEDINEIKKRLNKLEGQKFSLDSPQQQNEYQVKSGTDSTFVLSIVLTMSITLLLVVSAIHGFRYWKGISNQILTPSPIITSNSVSSNTLRQTPTISRTVASGAEKRQRLSNARETHIDFAVPKMSEADDTILCRSRMPERWASNPEQNDSRNSVSQKASDAAQPIVLRSILKKKALERQISSPIH